MSAFEKRPRFYLFVAALILVVALLALLFLSLWEKRHSDFRFESDFEMAGKLEYEGKTYTLRNGIETILVVGLDKNDRTGLEQSAYNNDLCADFLTLFVIDRNEKTYSAIHLNRDTMTQITKLGIGGKHLGKTTAQLSLSHTYGSGKDDSAINTARAVSAVFGGLRIDRYLSMTMDAVALVNDKVGGVTVTVEQDLSAVNPAWQIGERVTLQGADALAYVRARSGLPDSSNEARMIRQRQYMEALYGQLLAYDAANGNASLQTYTELAPYISTNCSTNDVDTLLERFRAYEKGEFYTLQGEYRVAEHVEFYPSDTSVKQLLITLFYKVK